MVSLFALKKRVLIKQLARAEEKAQKAFIKSEKEKQLKSIRKMIKAQKVSTVQAKKSVKNALTLKQVGKGLGLGLDNVVKTAKLLEKAATKQKKTRQSRRKK